LLPFAAEFVFINIKALRNRFLTEMGVYSLSLCGNIRFTLIVAAMVHGISKKALSNRQLC